MAGIAIFFAVAAVVVLTARDPGLTWDEAIYLGSAANYLDWFSNLSTDSFRETAIFQTWWQADHPPLGKLWIALSLAAFGGSLNLITAARVGAAILFGAAAAVLYLWLGRRHGRRVGVIAAVAFVLMPRLFAHGHFANLEMPMLLLWLLTVIAFERGIESRSWSVACGVLFGLALLTKINAVFLPVVLVPWGLLFHGRKARRNIIAMAIIGPLLFLAAWPVMWRNPLQGTWEYFANKTGRMIIPTYYLGVSYRVRLAPFHYPFIMLLATTPVLILAAAACAIRRAVQRLRSEGRAAGHEVLLLWNFAFPVLLLAAPGVPKYDGIRLMLPAYPFLAALAAVGAAAGWEWVRSRSFSRKPQEAGWVVGAVAALWLLLPVVAFHPFQLCYYGELAGGPWGARRIGFETTYWHDTFDDKALAYLSAHVPQGGRVALVGVEYRVWRIYQGLGELRPDLRHTDFDRSDWDYLLVIPRQGWLTDAERAFMETHEPAWTRTLPPFDTPPVCLIYSRP